jgi:hypothetical protein
MNMALVNKKVSLNSKKITRAMKDSRYDSKYFENKENLIKSISLKRDIDKNSFNYTI